MTTKISTIFSCRASEFPDLSSDDSRIKIYAGNVDWMPLWTQGDTQTTMSAVYLYQHFQVEGPPDPKLYNQYTLQFPSMHFFTFFDTTSWTLSHHQSCLLHWFPQASEWFEKSHFSSKIQVIGGSIGCEFWFHIPPIFLRIGKTHHPRHLGTWLNGR